MPNQRLTLVMVHMILVQIHLTGSVRPEATTLSLKRAPTKRLTESIALYMPAQLHYHIVQIMENKKLVHWLSVQ